MSTSGGQAASVCRSADGPQGVEGHVHHVQDAEAPG